MCCCVLEIMTSVTSSCQCSVHSSVSEAERESDPESRTGQCSVISGRCGGDVVLKLAPYFLTTSDAVQGQSGEVTFINYSGSCSDESSIEK